MSLSKPSLGRLQQEPSSTRYSKKEEKKCWNCRSVLRDTDKHCPICGKPPHGPLDIILGLVGIMVVICLLLRWMGGTDTKPLRDLLGPTLDLSVTTTLVGNLVIQNNHAKDYHLCNITVNNNWRQYGVPLYAGRKEDFYPNQFFSNQGTELSPDAVITKVKVECNEGSGTYEFSR